MVKSFHANTELPESFGSKFQKGVLQDLAYIYDPPSWSISEQRENKGQHFISHCFQLIPLGIKLFIKEIDTDIIKAIEGYKV